MHLWEHDVGKLYELCLRPALLRHAENFRVNYWQPHFDNLYEQSAERYEDLQDVMVTVLRHSLPAFWTTLKNLLQAHPLFRNGYLVHEYHPSLSCHDNTSASERRDGWALFTSLLANRTDAFLQEWQAEVEVSWQLRNRTLLWKPSGMHQVLVELFSDMDQGDLQQRLDQPTSFYAGPTEWSPARVELNTAKFTGDHNTRRMLFITEEPRTVQEHQEWVPYTPSHLFPDNMEWLGKQVQGLTRLFKLGVEKSAKPEDHREAPDDKMANQCCIRLHTSLIGAKNSFLALPSPQSLFYTVPTVVWW